MTRTMLGPVRTPRVYEHIVAQFERAIYDGRLQQGDKLPPERQLVRDFRASRVAVREALRALEHRGLVEVRQGSAGGYFVREVDDGPLVRDFQTLLRCGRLTLPHLIEARLLVEPEIARLAAARATDADIKALLMVMDERAAHAAAGGTGRELDIRFHRLVADAAKNPVHAALVHVLMDVESEVSAPRPGFGPGDAVAIVTAHRDVVDAIAARQPEAAATAMRAHVLDVQSRLAAFARVPAAC